MSNPLTKILGSLTPPPVVLTPDYDGLEFKWAFIVFRPALFKTEGVLLATVLFYILAHYIGKRASLSRAYKWFDAHEAVYETQFSKPVQVGGLTQDGSSDLFGFSTGRRAVASLHTVFALRPRHDFFQYAYEILRGFVDLDWKVVDSVELDFTFQDSANVPECIWAVVAKSELKEIKNTRWDLSFTRTTDHASLPPSFTVMSEFADVTENLMKQHGPFSLGSVLSNPAIRPYFRSLSITDQPRARPLAPLPASRRTKHLILSLAVPPSSSASATVPLVEAIFTFVDIVAGAGGWSIGKGQSAKGGAGLAASLRPDTKTKLRATREKLDKELKEEAEKEKREEAEAEKAAAKKKAEEERLSKLSAAEQKKALDREKKRLMRKSQGKVKMR